MFDLCGMFKRAPKNLAPTNSLCNRVVWESRRVDPELSASFSGALRALGREPGAKSPREARTREDRLALRVAIRALRARSHRHGPKSLTAQAQIAEDAYQRAAGIRKGLAFGTSLIRGLEYAARRSEEEGYEDLSDACFHAESAAYERRRGLKSTPQQRADLRLGVAIIRRYLRGTQHEYPDPQQETDGQHRRLSQCQRIAAHRAENLFAELAEND